tara:strand:- start:95 stop:1345 length:1251 start_codon:yes stop_codon:yes gene_type:complete
MEDYKILLLYCCPVFLIELYGKLLDYSNCVVYIREIQNIKPAEFDFYDAIIPCDVYSQNFLNENLENCFTNKNKNLCEILDNKNTFHNFIENYYKKIKNKDIKLIPTLTDITKESAKNFINLNDEHDNFIIKHNKACGGVWQKKFNKKDIDEIYSLSLNNYVLQPVVDIKSIYSLDAVCTKGEILSYLIYKYNSVCSTTKFSSYKEIKDIFFTEIVSKGDIYDKILKFSKKLIKKTKYSSIINIEFTIDNKGVIHLLEINPRISGNCVANENNKKEFNYFQKIIIPYLNKLNVKLLDKNHDIVDNTNNIKENVQCNFLSIYKFYFYFKTCIFFVINIVKNPKIAPLYFKFLLLGIALISLGCFILYKLISCKIMLNIKYIVILLILSPYIFIKVFWFLYTNSNDILTFYKKNLATF